MNPTNRISHLFRTLLRPTNILRVNSVRTVKTTSDVHPKAVYTDDETLLENLLEKRESCDDLPVTMSSNPYERPRKQCVLCKHNITPNWKNVKLLYQFISPYTGLILQSNITGLCKQKQTEVIHEITFARRLGMMGRLHKEVEFLDDPKLGDLERPFRPHVH